MNVQRVKAGIATIKKALEFYTDGWANEKARKEVLDACNSIEWACDEGDYIIEKIGDIRIAADNLYSARKHHRFKQGSSTGVQVLRAQILSLLWRIETQPSLLAQTDVASENQPPTRE